MCCEVISSSVIFAVYCVPVRSAEYCDQPVCLCVCLSVCVHVCRSVCEHISGTAGPIFTKFCVRIPCGRGSVLLRRRCATLFTSSFVDDVTFGRNGRDAERWRLTHAATATNDVAIPGRSLISMNALFSSATLLPSSS